MELEEVQTDLTEKEEESLSNYIKNGKPGLGKIKDTDVFQWFELYMSGKSYDEIAKITKSKKDLILFISRRSNWFDKKTSYYNTIKTNMTQKVQQAKLNSLDTVTSAVNALGKYYHDKFNEYLAKNDDSIIENLDTKILSQYYKSMEILEKIIGGSVSGSNGNSSGGSNININVGQASVEQKDANTVEINSDISGEMLRLLAKAKKESEDDEE